jgi:hypothetical protein
MTFQAIYSQSVSFVNYIMYSFTNLVRMPFHLSLFFANMLFISMYGYSIIHDADILCIGRISVGLLLIGIFSLVSIVGTVMLVIWTSRNGSKTCQKILFLLILAINIMAIILILYLGLLTVLKNSGTIVKGNNGISYKCNAGVSDIGEALSYGVPNNANKVLNFNVNQSVEIDNKCVFQPMNDICGEFGCFRQSTEVRDKQGVLGAYLCSKNDTEGVSICTMHFKTLNSYIFLALLTGILLNFSLPLSNILLLSVNC